MGVRWVEMAGVRSDPVTVIGALKQVITREIHAAIWS
jgi:hypothetical protein